MVCPIGSGRMAVMARLLEAESFSHTTAEKVGHQKLAAKYLYRELREADEVNLLDDEDMHVFGLKPMSDPLQLVCCNACKKPVKASQYVAHAELCRSLHSMGDIILEVESGISLKKPPRKDRKKLLTAHAKQATSVDHERQELVNASDTAVLKSRLDGQIGIKASLRVEEKETPVSVNVAHMADGYGMSPGITDYSDSMIPPAKRSKLISGDHLPVLNDSELSGVTKRMSNQDANTYAPVPLASKTYYSQRSNRLRSTLTHLYCKASAKELYADAMSPKISQERKTLLQTSPLKDSSLEGTDDQYKKRDGYSITPFQEPEFAPAQHSKVCLGILGRSPAEVNSPDQAPADGISRLEIAPVGFTGSTYLLEPYSFPVNSGKPMGIQHPNGGVPVT